MRKSKKIEKYNSMLRKYQSKKEIVKISRTLKKEKNEIYGVITGLSEKLMHLALNDGFKFNGEVIITTKHYDSIRCNDYDNTTTRILKAEKQISKSKPKRTKVDLSSWSSVFYYLKKQDIHVIVECEELKNPTFAIGPIQKIKKKCLVVKDYDPNGRFYKNTTKIKYKNITTLKFNDEYSITFRKYLEQPKQNQKTTS